MNKKTLYHYTDQTGVEGIKKAGKITTQKGKIYLTTVPPGKARPVFSQKEEETFRQYLSGKKRVSNLKSWQEKAVLSFKLNWYFGFLGLICKQPIIPIGAHKLEYFLVLTPKKRHLLKRDQYGQVYVEKPINLKGDSFFEVSGPFHTKKKA